MFRKMFGGESFFLGKYEHPDGGKLTFAPSIPGSVQHRQLSNSSLKIMAGGFLACTPGVNIKANFGGWKAFFQVKELFYLRLQEMAICF